MKTACKIAFPVQDFLFFITRKHIILIGGNFAIRRLALIAVKGYKPLDSCLPDDNMISHKLYQADLKFKRFSDCWNQTSTRRFQKNPLEAAYGLLSIFAPHYYHEKKD